MQKVIIFTNARGGVSVCYPTGELPIETVLEKDTPSGSNARIVDISVIPQDKIDFFMAFEMPNTPDAQIVVNFDKAKDVTRDRLRAEREPLFAPLDVAYMQAIERGQDTTAIVAEKNRLRSITSLVDPCTTLDQLRALKAAA
jgi:hypothetical protein